MEMAHVLFVVQILFGIGGVEEAIHLLHLAEEVQESGGELDDVLQPDLLE